MNIRTLYEATAREHLRSNGIYPPMEATMNEAKLSAAQRSYDNRMPDDEGDRMDAWVDHIIGSRDELADVLEEHYTRPIAEFLAYAMDDEKLPRNSRDREIVWAAEEEVKVLIYDYCRKEAAEPTSAQMDAYDDREAGR